MSAEGGIDDAEYQSFCLGRPRHRATMPAQESLTPLLVLAAPAGKYS